MPVGPAVYDPDEQDEMRSNLAFVADFDHFSEDAYFGLNDYTGNQNSLALNLMYNHYFTYRSSLIVGVQGHLDYYREKFLNPTPWIAANSVRNYDFDRNEREAGAYAEYTYAIKDKFSIVAGIRGDYNHYYDRFFVTPRGHLNGTSPVDHLPRLGRSGLPFDERHHRQYRRPGHGPGDSRPWTMNRGSSISGNSTAWRRP